MNRTPNNAKLQDIAKEVARRIMVKHHRLSNQAGIHNLQPWAKMVEAAPDQISSFMSQQDFQIILKRDIDIVTHFSGRSQSTIQTQSGLKVTTVRFQDRILLLNPLICTGRRMGRFESWSRPSSETLMQNNHLFSSPTPDRSHYLRNIDFKSVENSVFNKGVGILADINKLVLYAIFNAPVGTLPPGGLNCSNILKLQCARLAREKGSGYRVCYHGYPISDQELNNDFAGLKNQVRSRLRRNILAIPSNRLDTQKWIRLIRS